MDEYISKQDVLQMIESDAMWNRSFAVLYDDISDMPAADVAPVVRCKDCKHYQQNPYSDEDDTWCMLWADWIPTEPDDFCSYGERKEGAE